MKRRLLTSAAFSVALGLSTIANTAAQEQAPLPAAQAATETVSAPATAAPTPADAFANIPIPPPSRVRPAENTDEGGLWGLSDRAELQARASGELERDPALNAYLRGVACHVAAQNCGDIRLYVMNRPFFNAQMAPNGYMEVWSGLLLRVDDEAQLAFVLGHEIGHYAQNHSLAALHAAHNRATAALVLSLGLGAVGAGALGNLVYLGAIASIFSFSRAQESQADMIGFDNAVAAGYDPHAGEALWNNLIAESRVSDNPDVRRREAHGSVFNSHPLSADRVEALTQRATGHAAGETQRERYRTAIRPFLDPWLRAELRRRDFSQTLLLLDRLGSHSEDLGIVEYYRGEVFRIRRGDGDLARAKEHYLAALAHADAPAATWRELGEFEARDGHNAEAAQLFRSYLERAPSAGDSALIQARITQISGGTP